MCPTRVMQWGVLSSRFNTLLYSRGFGNPGVNKCYIVEDSGFQVSISVIMLWIIRLQVSTSGIRWTILRFPDVKASVISYGL